MTGPSGIDEALDDLEARHALARDEACALGTHYYVRRPPKVEGGPQWTCWHCDEPAPEQPGVRAVAS
jgi:hypothetical protein